MRVVLDTDVIVRAIRTPTGASAMLVVEALRGRITPLVSTALGLEYEAVAMRAEHWLQPGFGRAEAERFLEALAAVAEPVEISFRWRGFSPGCKRRDGTGGGLERRGLRLGDVQPTAFRGSRCAVQFGVAHAGGYIGGAKDSA